MGEVPGYDLIAQLVDEYRERERQGNAPSIDEYFEECLERYPQQTEEFKTELRQELDDYKWAKEFFSGVSLTEDLLDIDMDAVWDRFYQQIQELERNVPLRRRFIRRIRSLLLRLFK